MYPALATGVWNLGGDGLSGQQTDFILSLRGRGLGLPENHTSAVCPGSEGVVSKAIFQTFLCRCVPIFEQIFDMQ